MLIRHDLRALRSPVLPRQRSTLQPCNPLSLRAKPVVLNSDYLGEATSPNAYRDDLTLNGQDIKFDGQR